MASGGYHSLGADSCENSQDLVSVVSFVGSDSLSGAIARQHLEQCCGLSAVIGLTSGQDPAGQQTEPFDKSVDLGGEPPA